MLPAWLKMDWSSFIFLPGKNLGKTTVFEACTKAAKWTVHKRKCFSKWKKNMSEGKLCHKVFEKQNLNNSSKDQGLSASVFFKDVTVGPEVLTGHGQRSRN